MANILYGSQTFPWQMNIEEFHGQVPHFIDVLSEAGFTGIEAEICMLESYYKDWVKFKDVLDLKNIKFAALAFHLDWVHSKETDEEFLLADEAIEFVSHFPGAKLMLAHLAIHPEREKDLRYKQDCQIACIDAIAKRAAERGIVTAFHPNSAPNSVFRYKDDYAYLLERISKSPIGLAPDIGHMANGNLDVLQTVKDYRNKIVHVHFKDMDANHEWATMGNGIIDFKSIVDFLKDTDYRGWIITEDESPSAVQDSDSVVLADGKYIQAIK